MLTTGGIVLYNIQGVKVDKILYKFQISSWNNGSHCRSVYSCAFPSTFITWEEHSECAVILDAAFQHLLILGYSIFVPRTPLPSLISLLDP